MDIKNLMGETVIHKSFGKGVVENVYERYLEVFFPDCGRRSKFAYPSCFDAFLKLENEEKAAAAAKDVAQWRIESGAEQKEKCRQQYEKTQQDMRERQMAAEVKRKRMGQRTLGFHLNDRKAEDRAEEKTDVG